MVYMFIPPIYRDFGYGLLVIFLKMTEPGDQQMGFKKDYWSKNRE